MLLNFVLQNEGYPSLFSPQKEQSPFYFAGAAVATKGKISLALFSPQKEQSPFYFAGAAVAAKAKSSLARYA